MSQRGDGKSDGFVVPEKPGNESWRQEEDQVEGRRPAKENAPQFQGPRTQRRPMCPPQGLQRIREAAERDRKLKFTTLWHHVYDPARLKESYFGLRRSAAAGVDGVTWEEYGEGLDGRLAALSQRLARGSYRPAPVRRQYIPKAGGGLRPLGIPALEDKIVQRAVTEVLTCIYEIDFLGFSYGFRPGRSPHMALDALSVGLEQRKVNWVLDADIRGFFDTINHEWLIRFVEHRVADKRVIRTIQKWLKAGVLEEGRVASTEAGTPQGGIISPLLANIYLHYVLDLWVEKWRKIAAGELIVVRYADDFVLGFQNEGDACRFREELTARLEKFDLALHPDKTRLIQFGRYAAERRARRGQRKPDTFDFLGFTHFCSRTKAGWFQVGRRTSRKRLAAKAAAVRERLRRMMHLPIPVVGAWLGQVVNGHYAYFAVPGNQHALTAFRKRVVEAWRKALSRRSQKGQVSKYRITRIWRRFAPSPDIRHPYPSERFAVRIQGRSPVR